MLTGVWRALRCSAERQPVILGSPGEGYHLYLPLTRGPRSSNPEHTWPAACARLLDLFGSLSWDPDFDYKRERMHSG